MTSDGLELTSRFEPTTDRVVDLLETLFFPTMEPARSRAALRAVAKRPRPLTGLHGRDPCIQEVDGGVRLHAGAEP